MSHLDRIAALLAKAERSDNPHEAEAYLAKAQALATQASVDLAVARALTARREAREQPVSVTIRKTNAQGLPVNESNRLCVHADTVVAHARALHAQGWDHETSEADAEAMEAHEIEIMRKLGFKNPY